MIVPHLAGYMAEQFDAKPVEIKALFNNQLDSARTVVLRDRILAAELPTQFLMEFA